MHRALVALLMGLLGGCRAGPGEACGQAGDCSEPLTCHAGVCRDPAAFCRTEPEHAEGCRRDGRCTLRDGQCVAAGDEDCRGSLRCTRFGQCTAASGCCSQAGVCAADEDDPVTQLLALERADGRAVALDKLRAQLDSRLLQAGGDRRAPELVAFGTTAAKALAALAGDEEADIAARKKAVAMLADLRHPDGAPAMVAALEAKGLLDEGTLPRVLTALAAMRVEAAREPIFQRFRTTTSAALAAPLGRAAAALARPAWEAELLAMLQASEGDEALAGSYRRVHAARALGRLRSTKAIAPLLSLAIAGRDGQAVAAAIEALVLIGKPAADAAAAALAGEDAALAQRLEQVERAAADEPVGGGQARRRDHLRVAGAAVVLAHIGRRDAIEPVLEAFDATDDIGRAAIAWALIELPHTDAVRAAFRTRIEKLPVDVPVSPRHDGVDALYEVVPWLFAPELSDWLVARGVAAPGNDTAAAPFRDAALKAALCVATAERLAGLEPLTALVTKSKWEQPLAEAKALLSRCEQKVPCHLAAASGRGSEGEAVKAAVIAGALAEPADRPAFEAALARAHHPQAREALARALVHLSPDGDAELAQRLEALAAERGWIDDAIIVAMGRLRARAE